MVSNVIAIPKGYSPASQGHLPPILQDPPINYKIINKITSKKMILSSNVVHSIIEFYSICASLKV